MLHFGNVYVFKLSSIGHQLLSSMPVAEPRTLAQVTGENEEAFEVFGDYLYERSGDDWVVVTSTGRPNVDDYFEHYGKTIQDIQRVLQTSWSEGVIVRN